MAEVNLQDFIFAETSKRKTNFYDYDTTIAGRRGSGKSTLAIELFKGHCCIVDVEKGNKYVDGVPKVEPNTWKELISLQKTWRKAMKQGAKPPFDVLLFDTQTKLALMCQEYVLDENDWEDFTQGSDGKNRWTVLKAEFNSVMEGFKELGFKVVYICHGKDKEFKPRNGEKYNQYVADVGATFDYQVLGSVDFIFYLEKNRVKDDKGNSKEVRRLILQNDVDYDVKCRFPELPDVIEYEEVEDGVAEFYSAWDSAVKGVDVKKQAQNAFDFASSTSNDEKEVDNNESEDKTEEDENKLESLQAKALAVRDVMLEDGMTRKEMAALLKEKFGTAKIKEVTDEGALSEFIKENE